MEQGENIMLSSTESMRISLKAVREGTAGLNKHRKKLLERVPESGNWARFSKNSITLKDIAFLSAAVQHEFALLRGKQEDILFHGVALHCFFDDELIKLLKEHKFELIAHTHPDWDAIIPSQNDRNFLKVIGQERSIIVSSMTGKERAFGRSIFEDV